MTFKYSKDPAQLIFDDSFTTIGADPLEGAELTFSAELRGNYINITVINLFDPIISDELSDTIKTIAWCWIIILYKNGKTFAVD